MRCCTMGERRQLYEGWVEECEGGSCKLLAGGKDKVTSRFGGLSRSRVSCRTVEKIQVKRE